MKLYNLKLMAVTIMLRELLKMKTVHVKTQVTENNNDDKFKKAIDDAVMTVENCMHDAILTAMETVVIPWVEMTVRSITGSSEQRLSSVVQNTDRRDFTGNNENFPLLSASSRLNLNVEQYWDFEIRNVGNYEDGDFSALRAMYDRQPHTHHMVTQRNAPRKTISKIITGQLRTQNNWLPQHFTQLQNKRTRIPPDNTLPKVEQKHPRHNTQTQSTPLSDLLRQFLELHPNNGPKRCQH